MTSIHILLVEDNDGDILLKTETLKESKTKNKFTVIKNGKAAIEHFKCLLSKSDAADLVLFNTRLPKDNGYAVLQHIKKMNCPVIFR